jgi:hypothetical protein
LDAGFRWRLRLLLVDHAGDSVDLRLPLLRLNVSGHGLGFSGPNSASYRLYDGANYIRKAGRRTRAACHLPLRFLYLIMSFI